MSSLGLIGRRKPKNVTVDSSDVKTLNREQIVSNRIQEEINSIEQNDIFKIEYDPSNNPLKLTVFAAIESGLWAGGTFEFRFTFSPNYPESGPVITCISQTWHPNISMDGKPCVNVIRTDWSPSYGIELLLNAILFLFLEPNPRDGLNQEASDEMIFKDEVFLEHVLISLYGGIVESIDPTTKDPVTFTFHQNQHLNEALLGSDIRYSGIDIQSVKKKYVEMLRIGHEEYLRQQ